MATDPGTLSNPPWDVDLVAPAVRIIRHTQKWISEELLGDPEGALEQAHIGRRGKPLLTIDLVAERHTAHRLRDAFGGSKKIHVLGEESLRDPSIDLADEQRLVALLDMVDGTDLLARGLSNWCSAMIFYKQGQILGSFVGIPDEGIYYATQSQPGAFKKPPGKAPVESVRGPNRDSQLDTASICFYGQKPKNFLAVVERRGLLETLEDLPNARLYNLAGNPMMMRLIDGHVPVDAIFDVKGQHPHDVVPGAYIAERAGATLRGMDGNRIDLARSLRRPAHPDFELRYVLAASDRLCSDLVRILGEVEFRGRIESITLPSLRVRGRIVVTNSSTKFSGEGNAKVDVKVGMRVRVEGAAQPDGSVLARKIKAENEEGGLRREASG